MGVGKDSFEGIVDTGVTEGDSKQDKVMEVACEDIPFKDNEKIPGVTKRDWRDERKERKARQEVERQWKLRIYKRGRRKKKIKGGG